MQSRDSEIVSCVQQILDQLRRVMEGKDEQLLWALAAILARGHILLDLEGPQRDAQTSESLLALFKEKTTQALASDRVLFGTI